MPFITRATIRFFSAAFCFLVRSGGEVGALLTTRPAAALDSALYGLAAGVDDTERDGTGRLGRTGGEVTLMSSRALRFV